MGPQNLRRLDTSNGCQNHTASPYAAASFVCAPFDRSRVWLNPNPPCDSSARLMPPRPPHPAPTFVTMANAPLNGTGCKGNSFDLGLATTGMFLRGGLDRANHIEFVQEISLKPQTPILIPA